MVVAFGPWACASRPMKALRALFDEYDALIGMLREELLAAMRT
jgi:hypothetical protein